MRNVVMEDVGTLNIPKLDAGLRAAAAGYAGLSQRKNRRALVLHFEDSATDEAIATAQNLVRSHDPTEKTPGQQLVETIKSNAQSAAGVALNDLSAAQRNALMAVLLWRAGGVADDGTVRPLGEWLRD